MASRPATAKGPRSLLAGALKDVTKQAKSDLQAFESQHQDLLAQWGSHGQRTALANDPGMQPLISQWIDLRKKVEQLSQARFEEINIQVPINGSRLEKESSPPPPDTQLEVSAGQTASVRRSTSTDLSTGQRRKTMDKDSRKAGTSSNSKQFSSQTDLASLDQARAEGSGPNGGRRATQPDSSDAAAAAAAAAVAAALRLKQPQHQTKEQPPQPQSSTPQPQKVTSADADADATVDAPSMPDQQQHAEPMEQGTSSPIAQQASGGDEGSPTPEAPASPPACTAAVPAGQDPCAEQASPATAPAAAAEPQQQELASEASGSLPGNTSNGGSVVCSRTTSDAHEEFRFDKLLSSFKAQNERTSNGGGGDRTSNGGGPSGGSKYNVRPVHMMMRPKETGTLLSSSRYVDPNKPQPPPIQVPHALEAVPARQSSPSP